MPVGCQPEIRKGIWAGTHALTKLGKGLGSGQGGCSDVCVHGGSPVPRGKHRSLKGSRACRVLAVVCRGWSALDTMRRPVAVAVVGGRLGDKGDWERRGRCVWPYLRLVCTGRVLCLLRHLRLGLGP